MAHAALVKLIVKLKLRDGFILRFVKAGNESLVIQKYHTNFFKIADPHVDRLSALQLLIYFQIND